MKWLKAKVFLLLVSIVWLSLIVAMLPLMVLAVIFDRAWLYSLFLAQDHLVNVVLGGHYLTTISSQLGKLRQGGSRTGTVAADTLEVAEDYVIALRAIRHIRLTGKAAVDTATDFQTVAQNYINQLDAL